MSLILQSVVTGTSLQLLADNVKKSDWHILLGLLILIGIPVLIYFFILGLRNRRKKRVTVTLGKNRLYFPDYLVLTVSNNGKKAIDISNPLLVFSHLFLKRKLKLKGPAGYQIYPLFLEPGKTHELKIDLGHFYRYDRRLKKFPKATIYIRDVTGKINISQSVQLRKTLFT